MADKSVNKTFGHRVKRLGNFLDSTLWQLMGFDSLGKFRYNFDPNTEKEQFQATRLGKFSPDKQHEDSAKFMGSYKIHVNLKALDSLEIYKKAMEKDFTAFIDKADINDTDWKSLQAADDILPPMTNITNKFKEVKDDFIANNQSPDFTTLGLHALLIGQLVELKTETKKALEDQFIGDKDLIKKITLPNASDRKMHTFKQDMEKALTESYEKHSKALEQSMNDNIKAMHLSAQHERDRINELARMYTHGPASLKKQIQDLIDAEEKKLPDMTVVGSGYKDPVPADGPAAMLKHIDLDNIKQWETETGRIIKISDYVKNEDGTNTKRANKFSIEFPNRITGFMYYNSLEDNLKVDMMSLASAVKSRGFQSITMNITPHRNPDTQKLQIKLAYDACIENGFDPKKITIKVGGKKQNLDDIEKTKDEEAKAGLYTNTGGIQQQGKSLSETRAILFEQRQQQAKDELKNPKITPTVVRPLSSMNSSMNSSSASSSNISSNSRK